MPNLRLCEMLVIYFLGQLQRPCIVLEQVQEGWSRLEIQALVAQPSNACNDKINT